MVALATMTACKCGTANEQNIPESFAAMTARKSGTANEQNPRGGYTFEDVEITADEFHSAALCADQWQCVRSEREPLAEDTVIAREWFVKHGLEFTPELMDECGFYAFEGDNVIAICAGDYCVTRFLDDTTNMVGYDMVLGIEAAGCFLLAWGCGDMLEEPEYIYIYPMDLVAIEEGKPYIGKPYIYETTPKWCPTGNRQFWGEDNWFYVEGFNRNNEKVYHKVRPINK